MKAKLNDAFEEVNNITDPSKTSIDIITAYAAATVVYGNGQRSGVITNLTIDEFNIREEDNDGLVVIPCVHHRTAGQGLALLVITEEVEDVLQYYYDNIRNNIVPAEPDLQQYFLKHTGKMYAQVYRRIKEALASDNLIPPQPGLYRILVSSDARRHLDAKIS